MGVLRLRPVELVHLDIRHLHIPTPERELVHHHDIHVQLKDHVQRLLGNIELARIPLIHGHQGDRGVAAAHRYLGDVHHIRVVAQ